MSDSIASNPPQFIFKTHPSALSYAVQPQKYLSNHPDLDFKYLSAGAIVFDNIKSKDPRILLIQRSAHDSWPNCYEIPGGSCDNDDASLLHSAARELWEETGLTAVQVGPVLGEPFRFVTRSGKHIGYFVFFVEAEKDECGTLEVRLDPKEHQKYVWASESDVRRKKVGDVELEFTTVHMEATVLDAFTERTCHD